MSIVK